MNWSVYNDSLVRRGEILLDFSVLEGWDREVKRMSAGRRGRPFTYPDSLIRLLASIRLILHLPYRQLEGFTRALSRYVEGLAAPDYTTLNRRVNRLNISMDEALVSSDGPVYIALDSTGLKVHKSGDWIRRRFKVRKGYLKVHIAVNVETRQIVALEVTREYIHDGTRLEGLVEESSRKVEIKGVIGDGAYDSRRNFNLLDEKGIEPIIKVRRNAVKRLRGCPARRQALTMQRSGSDEWGRKYGLRWIAESAFSWMKRAFGEYVTAKRLKNMIQEITMKVFLYNLLIGMTKTA
jgi:IS5 family transposase